MDVVPHARTVRCRVVVPEDARGLATGEPVEHHRHDVEDTGVGQLRRRRPRDVEVAQAHRVHAVRLTGRPDQPLPGELGLAVGVHRGAGGVLRDEVHPRVAVHGGGGGEDEAPHTGLRGGVQERRQSAHVLPVVPGRLRHGLGDLLARREMQHPRHLVLGERPLQQLAVQRRAPDQRYALGKPPRHAGREVVQGDDALPGTCHGAHHMCPDVPGPAGDQPRHGRPP